MKATLVRHWRVFMVHMTEMMHFRLMAVVWFLVGAVNTVILLLYWLATLHAGNAGTGIPAITSYYLLLLALASIGVCHHESNIATQDVLKGHLSTYLLRPYPYLLIKFHQEIVWRLVMFAWAITALGGIMLLRIPLFITSDPRRLLVALLSLMLGLGVSFFLKSIIGLTAIWLTNIRGLMELASIAEIILSGFVVPLHFLPTTWRTLALLQPYASVIYTPVHMLIHEPSWAEVGQLLLQQVCWLVVLSLGAQWLFRTGVRHYTGVSQ